MAAATNGNLHHDSDTELGARSRKRPTTSVQSFATTANRPEWLGNPEWSADLEYVWRVRVAGDVAKLEARARRRRRQADQAETPRERVRLLRSGQWAHYRARSLALARADLVAVCGERWRTVGCRCGHREFRVDCKQTQLCGRCRSRHWQRWSRRITKAMDQALRAARAEWHRAPGRRGMVPGVYLITLTMPHGGDIEGDRKRMGEAVRRLFKVATHRQWWSTYALTYEVTPGDDKLGHVHAHLAAISSWIPYDELHAAWRAAMPGALVLDVSPPRRGSDQASMAAGYLAKYVTKGIEVADFTGRKAGELLCAFRGRRKVTTSRHFWLPPVHTCECCGELFRSVGAPASLQKVAPAAVLRSMAERARVWWDRGKPQVDLRFDGG